MLLLSIGLAFGSVLGFVAGLALKRAADRRPPKLRTRLTDSPNTRTGALLTEPPVLRFPNTDKD